MRASFNSKPDYHEATGLVSHMNGLHRSNFIHLDFLDFAVGVLLGMINVGDLHMIHDGLDCSTFTDLAKSSSQRHPCNAFAGTSISAYDTNLRHHLLVAFHLFLHREGSTEHCIRSAENPKASRQYHPLTLHVVELPKKEGGLGSACTPTPDQERALYTIGCLLQPESAPYVCVRVRVCACALAVAKAQFSFCHLAQKPAHSYQKHTCWWSDDTDTLHVFLTPEGEHRKVCSKDQPCHHFGSHLHLRPCKGDESDETRGSVYLFELCYMISCAASGHLGRVRCLDLDPAYTLDGSRDSCEACGNSRKGGKLHICTGCPAVFHWRCIPKGTAKPSTSAPWFCSRRECQEHKSGSV